MKLLTFSFGSGLLRGLLGSRRRLRPSRRRSGRRARTAIIAFPFAFLGCLSLAWSVLDAAAPERIDPSYSIRRTHLNERLREQPDARLAVVVGSSRTGDGFTPELCPPAETAEGRPVLWFNLSHYGAGPVFNLIAMKRLLREGLHPRVAVIEVMPPFAVEERLEFIAQNLTAAEARFASDYVPAGSLAWRMLRHRIHPKNLKSAFELPSPIAFGRYGGRENIDVVISPEEKVRRVEFQRRMHEWAAQHIAMSASADRALRDTLQLCADHSIEAVLLLTPESPAFRAMYDSEGLKRFEAGLHELAAQHGAKLIDARGWLDDSEFTDSHHPLHHGAITFTKRLMREVRVER